MQQKYAAMIVAPRRALAGSAATDLDGQVTVHLLHAACGGAIGKKPASERSSERDIKCQDMQCLPPPDTYARPPPPHTHTHTERSFGTQHSCMHC